jgi:hypothetical protein
MKNSRILLEKERKLNCISCETCNKKYIGENKIYEHKIFAKKRNVEISPIAEHCINENHVMDWQKSAVIKTSYDCFESKIYESIIRSFDQKVLLNRDKGQQLSNIWSTV